MKTSIAKEKLDTILAKVEKKGAAAPKLIEDLKELRVIALEEGDPLVVKILRLTYEFIEDKKCFNVILLIKSTFSVTKIWFTRK